MSNASLLQVVELNWTRSQNVAFVLRFDRFSFFFFDFYDDHHHHIVIVSRVTHTHKPTITILFNNHQFVFHTWRSSRLLMIIWPEVNIDLLVLVCVCDLIRFLLSSNPIKIVILTKTSRNIDFFICPLLDWWWCWLVLSCPSSVVSQRFSVCVSQFDLPQFCTTYWQERFDCVSIV